MLDKAKGLGSAGNWADTTCLDLAEMLHRLGWLDSAVVGDDTNRLGSGLLISAGSEGKLTRRDAAGAFGGAVQEV